MFQNIAILGPVIPEIDQEVAELTDAVFQIVWTMLPLSGAMIGVYIIYKVMFDRPSWGGRTSSLKEQAMLNGWNGRKFNAEFYGNVSPHKMKKLRKLYLKEVERKARYDMQYRTKIKVEDLGLYEDNDMEAIEIYLKAYGFTQVLAEN